MAAVSATMIGTTLNIVGGNGSDSADVSCSAGMVQVNGVGISPPTACNVVTAINMNGQGGDDVFTTDYVLPADFTALSGATVAGGDGNDELAATFGSDFIQGGPGNDRIVVSGGGNDTATGGTGTDTIAISAKANLTLTSTTLAAGSSGAALASFEAADLQVVAGVFGWTIDASAFPGPVEMYGTFLDDVLIGGSGNDYFEPGGGSDGISGSGGSDRVFIYGISGNLTLSDTQASYSGKTSTLASVEEAIINGPLGGGTIDATAFTGRTFFYSGSGNDVFYGGSGPDIFKAGSNAGADSFDGNAGIDEIHGIGSSDMSLASALLSISGTLVTFTDVERGLLAGDGGDVADFLEATSFPGPVTLYGNGGADTLIGGGFRDRIYGGAGDDVLKGLGNRDRLSGQEGDDTMIGGDGIDTCDGGSGNDTQRTCERGRA